MGIEQLEQELDDLLEDIHKIIDEEAELDPEADLPDLTPYLGEEEILPEPEPEPVEKPRPRYWTQTQKLPKHVAELQNNQEQAYAQWLYEQEEAGAKAEVSDFADDLAEEEPAKGHGLRTFVSILLVLALAALTAVVFLLPTQPKADTDLGARRSGVSTILLAGTDESGARTDTLMLLTVDRPQKAISLVSIPRDTLVNGNYNVPKINSVYGANKGGAEGIDMLMTRVAECIGFRPDGYMLIRLEAFTALVDRMGGVQFDVPVDMFYNDPEQDLFIDLKAGPQTLNGQQAMGVVRFRSGYTDADLGRVQVQRDLLAALMDQMLSLEGITKSPQLLNDLLAYTDSNLTVSNCLWLARTALLCDLRGIESVTLPGDARNFPGGSYYVLDPALVAQTVNTYCNPYETSVTTEHLNIRQG